MFQFYSIDYQYFSLVRDLFYMYQLLQIKKL
jgi:hypothetical protein